MSLEYKNLLMHYLQAISGTVTVAAVQGLANRVEKETKHEELDRIAVEALAVGLNVGDSQAKAETLKLIYTIIWNRHFIGKQIAPDFEHLKNAIQQGIVLVKARSGDLILPPVPFERQEPKTPTDSRDTETLIDCLVLALERTFTDHQNDSQSLTKIAVLVNMLLDSPKIRVHGESVKIMFSIAFKIYLKKHKETVKDDDSIPACFAPVESFLTNIMLRCERNSIVDVYSAIRKTLMPQSSFSDYSKLSPSNSMVRSPSSSQMSSAPVYKRTKSFKSYSENASTAATPKATAKVPTLVYDEGEMRELEGYLDKYMTYLVDQTEMHIQRIEKLKTSFKRSPEEFDEQIKRFVPLYLVPKENDPHPSLYSRAVKVEVSNECNKTCGVFGWCYICRNPAEFFCREARVPVCTKKCKDEVAKLFKIVDYLQLEPKLITPAGNLTEMNKFKLDAFIVLNYIFSLANLEISTPQKSDLVMSGLVDCMTIALDKAGVTINNAPEFIQMLQENILKAIGPSLLLFTPKVSKKACQLLNSLFKRYRMHLKIQLYLILDSTLLKILEANAAVIETRNAFLMFVAGILGQRDIVVDIYTNYDCCSGYGNTLERCIDLFVMLATAVAPPQNQKEITVSHQPATNRNQLDTVAALQKFGLDAIFTLLCRFAATSNRQMGDIQGPVTPVNPNNQNIADTIRESKELKDAHLKYIEAFNQNATQGILKAQQNNFVSGDHFAEDYSVFLMSNLEFVDKSALGKYFGSPEEANQELLREFTKQMNLRGLELDDAMRVFLSHFALPGESQQIDRIITVFSEEYVAQNPNKLCSNSAYLLAYSLMMLQTDAHNKNVLNKMELDQFLKMAKAIKVKETIPLEEDYLTRLYHSVTEVPLSEHHSVKAKVDMTKVDAPNDQNEQSRKRQYAVVLCLAEGGLNVERDQEFLIVSASDISHTIFAELIYPKIGPKLFQIVLQGNNEKHTLSATNCLIKMLAICETSQELETQRTEILEEVIRLTGVSSTGPQLTSKNVTFTSAIFVLLKENFRGLRGSWPSFLKMANALRIKTQLHMKELNQKKSETGFAQPRGTPLDHLLSLISPEEINSTFDLGRGLSEPLEAASFLQAIFICVREEFFSEAIPAMFLLEKAIKFYLSKTGGSSEMLVLTTEVLAEFIKTFSTVWPKNMEQEILDLLMSAGLAALLAFDRLNKNNRVICDSFYHIHTHKNDPQVSERLLDQLLSATRNNHIKHIGYGWSTMVDIFEDLITKGPHRTIIRAKIFQTVRIALRYLDSSCLDHKYKIAEFLRQQAIKKPPDESTRHYLGLYIEFLLYTSAALLKFDLSSLKMTKLMPNGQLVEAPVKLFGQSEMPSCQIEQPQASSTVQEIFNQLFMPAMMMTTELTPDVFGLEAYCDYLLKVVSVLLAYQSLMISDSGLFKVVLHGFLLPTVDDCIGLAKRTQGKLWRDLMSCSQHFLIETVMFLYLANQLEHIKPVVSMIVSKLVEESTADMHTSSPLLLGVLAYTYHEIAFEMDYKDRFTLFNTLLNLMNLYQEKLAGFMKISFKCTQSKEKAEAIASYEGFHQGATLIVKILLKSYPFITEDLLGRIKAIVKQASSLGIRFDNSVRERIRFFKNLFHEHISSLPSMRIARRALILTKIYLNLKNLEANPDSPEALKNLEDVAAELNFYVITAQDPALDGSTSTSSVRGSVHSEALSDYDLEKSNIQSKMQGLEGIQQSQQEDYNRVKSDELKKELSMRQELILEDIFLLLIENGSLIVRSQGLKLAVARFGALFVEPDLICSKDINILMHAASRFNEPIYQRLLALLNSNVD